MQSENSTKGSARDRDEREVETDTGKLLDLLTAVRWDLHSGLRDGVAAPDEFALDISRVFENIDASIAKLREIIRVRGLPV